MKNLTMDALDFPGNKERIAEAADRRRIRESVNNDDG